MLCTWEEKFGTKFDMYCILLSVVGVGHVSII